MAKREVTISEGVQGGELYFSCSEYYENVLKFQMNLKDKKKSF